MPSNLSSVGFPIATGEDFRLLAERVFQEGEEHRASRGSYHLLAPGGGAELWLQTTKRQMLGLNPHFSGPSRIEVGVAGRRDGDTPMEGVLSVWASPETAEPESGTYPFVVDVPDWDLGARRLKAGDRATLQVAAFAHELEIFDDAAAYDSAQTTEPRFATESFVPTGMFGDEGEHPQATALFSGVVLDHNRATNPATGADFYTLQVRTLGGEYDVVADPELVHRAPAVDSVVRVSAWLSGPVVDDDSRSSFLGRLRRR